MEMKKFKEEIQPEIDEIQSNHYAYGGHFRRPGTAWNGKHNYYGHSGAHGYPGGYGGHGFPHHGGYGYGGYPHHAGYGELRDPAHFSPYRHVSPVRQIANSS